MEGFGGGGSGGSGDGVEMPGRAGHDDNGDGAARASVLFCCGILN